MFFRVACSIWNCEFFPLFFSFSFFRFFYDGKMVRELRNNSTKRFISIFNHCFHSMCLYFATVSANMNGIWFVWCVSSRSHNNTSLFLIAEKRKWKNLLHFILSALFLTQNFICWTCCSKKKNSNSISSGKFSMILYVASSFMFDTWIWIWIWNWMNVVNR